MLLGYFKSHFQLINSEIKLIKVKWVKIGEMIILAKLLEKQSNTIIKQTHLDTGVNGYTCIHILSTMPHHNFANKH